MKANSKLLLGLAWAALQRLVQSALIAIMLLLALPAGAQVYSQIPAHSTWRYLGNGSDLGTAWLQPNFNDSAWPSGPARLGFGGDGEQTVLSAGQVTYYFRRAFTVTNVTAVSNLQMRLQRDDGAVVYLNGIEVFRSNMPTGAVNHLTFAASATTAPVETNGVFSPVLTSSLLIPGTNSLAVEVHQASANDGDLGFDLELQGNVPEPTSLTTPLTPSQSWSTIANNFHRGGNTLNEVLPQVAAGTRILKWNPAMQSYNASFYDAQTAEWTPNASLHPGEGAWIFSPIVQTITFTGTLPQRPGPMTRPSVSGLHFLSGRWPVASTFEEMSGYPPAEGDAVITYEGAFANLSSQPTRVFAFGNGVWNPPLPLLTPGQSVFVNLAPFRLSCPSPKTVPCGVAWTFDPPTPSGACCSNVLVQLVSSNSIFNSSCLTRWQGIWRVTDCCSNSLICTQIVSVVDTTPPSILCPTNLVFDCSRSNGAVVDFMVGASDACGIDRLVCMPPSGTFLPVGDTIVNCVAYDLCGNSNYCSFTITVLSNCPPTSCSQNLLVNGSFESPGLPDEYAYLAGNSTFITGWKTLLNGVEYADPRSMSPEVMQAGVAAEGAYTIDLGVLSYAGGGIEQTFATRPNQQYHVSFKMGTYQFHGRDGTASLTAEADWGPSVPRHSEAFSTANYDARNIGWSLKRFTFTTPPVGTETTLRFTSNNDGDTNFVALDDVRVTDCCIELICPPQVTAECQTPNGAPVAWTVVAVNHCKPNELTVTCTPPSGSWFPPGTTYVTCTASGSGVTQTCTFPVIVEGSCGGLCEENLLVNGSFEQPGRADGYLAIPVGSTPALLPGWTVLPAGVEYYDGTALHPSVSDPGPADDGSFAIDLAYLTSPTGGGIKQFVTTIPGERYVLSFSTGTAETFGRLGTGRLEVSAGAMLRTFDVEHHGNRVRWERFSFAFLANSSSTLIKFTITNNANLHYVGLDNVRLTRCPTNEPSGPGLTWTPMGHCQLRLCWSDPAGNWRLQYTTNLTSPVRWRDWIAPIATNGSERCVVLSNICDGMIFFQLARASLPVFNVAGPAVSPAQFNLLAGQLNLPPEAYDTNGFVRFTDADRFQAVPAEVLGVAANRDEEDVPLVETRLLFDQINAMKVLPDTMALQLASNALAGAGLLQPGPIGPYAEAVHSRLKAVSTAGATVSDVSIDTKVRHQFTLGGLPLIGPGAKAAIHFDATGAVTRVNYTLRPLQPAAEVPLLPQSAADAKIGQAYQEFLQHQPGQLSLQATLVYFAPAPELGGVQMLLPHYQYQGTFQPQEGGAPILLRTMLIPAVASSNLVPSARMTVNIANGFVSAQALVSGGRAPYSYVWNSSSVVLDETNSASLSYLPKPRDQETLTLLVLDANGISASVSSNLVLNVGPFSPLDDGGGIVAAGAVSTEIDVGTEWIGLTGGLPGAPANARGFVSRMRADSSVIMRFNWGELNAWERDFKDPDFGGDDRRWVDNVDAVFYTGHANDDGWVFTSAHDDGFIDYTQTRYGEVDLEWLVVAACGPLQEGARPTEWWQQWGPAFRGLHLLCGYDNLSEDVSDEGRKWADYLLRGRTVAQAWMLTGIESQSWSLLNVCVMTSFDARAVCNMNDHFWGKGSVGPDIRTPSGFVRYSSPVD